MSSGGTPIPDGLTIRINRRARRISLRVNAKGEAVLVLPDEKLRAEGLRFARQKQDWLAKQQTSQPGRVPFAIGNTIPLRGALMRIDHNPNGRDPITVSDDTVVVSGREALAEKLILAWLRREAAEDFQSAVGHYAGLLRLPAPPITLRDPKTRWGSCSSAKRLSLSWRLVLAPPEVLDYVAAHEVAHLCEMNHSDRFWAIVRSLCPDFRAQEAWLKKHGRDLHRFG